MMGDEVAFARDQELQVVLPKRGRLRLIRDGETILEEVGKSLAHPVPGPGIYRVEVSRKGKLWILSNPIYVR